MYKRDPSEKAFVLARLSWVTCVTFTTLGGASGERSQEVAPANAMATMVRIHNQPGRAFRAVLGAIAGAAAEFETVMTPDVSKIRPRRSKTKVI